MSAPDNAREHAFECLRIAAECRNLSSDVPMHHRAHYWRMAGVWEELAQEFYDLNTSDNA
jgi:hypothetical protein